MRIKHTLLGIYTYLEFGACLVAVLPMLALADVAHRKDPTKRIQGRWVRRLGRMSSALTPIWKFRVEGQAPADIDHRGYVVISNHESDADTFLLSHLPWDMRWIAKQELFKVPVTGWVMRMGGDIPVRRGERSSVEAMMAEAVRTLRQGLSVMVFPEGTRSPDGQLLPFKDGAFQMAIEAQVPVLPVVIAGTHAMRPKNSRWFGGAFAGARILEPVPTTGLDPGDVEQLKAQCRQAMAQALTEMRPRYGR